MALIDKETIDNMNNNALQRLRKENEELKEAAKDVCLDKIQKPKNLYLLTDSLMCSPYLDVLSGERKDYEKAAEHLMKEDVIKVIRCKTCQESEVCPDTLLWCNQFERLVPPMGFCHCGKQKKEFE